MTVPVVFAALCTATAVFVAVRVLWRPPMRLAPRVAPYSDRVRQRLGTAVAHTPTGATMSLWAPLIGAAARAIGALGDAGTADTLTIRLRQAGMGAVTVDDYRRRQLGYTVAGAAIGFAAATVVQLSAVGSLALTLIGGFIGLSQSRAAIDRRIETRRNVMQAEAHMVCQLLAIYLRTGDTPQGAIERFTGRSEGLISDQLAAAIGQIRAGSPAPGVFDQLAATTVEPTAARLYRLYGATWSASGDPVALLALAETLRAGRREQLARKMTKRNTLMVLPLVVIIGPITILFILAALPSIIFGR